MYIPSDMEIGFSIARHRALSLRHANHGLPMRCEKAQNTILDCASRKTYIGCSRPPRLRGGVSMDAGVSTSTFARASVRWATALVSAAIALLLARELHPFLGEL